MKIKLVSGRYMINADIEIDKGYIYLTFPYSKALLDEVRTSFENAHWCGFDEKARKAWRVPITERNLFVLKYLQGQKPYAQYTSDLIEYKSIRPLWEHQLLMVRQILTRKNCILAAEMGTGKTLAMIEAMEYLKNTSGRPDDDFWYIGPKSGVAAVNLELDKWDCKIRPKMLTYQGLVKMISESEVPDPYFICFDESAKVKTPGSQRSKAAKFVADAIRKDGYVVLMSGAPAPRSPVDWWHQAEVACPGFLREADIFKFRKTLAVTEERENSIGGKYGHLVTWLDDENKCAICGQYEHDSVHQIGITTTQPIAVAKNDKASAVSATTAEPHVFKKSKNEVARLYKRLQGLTVVINKKDCLDLPDKIYKIIRIKPDPDTVRAAKVIAEMESLAISASIKLRELSDGFQYIDVPDGESTCDVCHGSGRETIPDEHICSQCMGKGVVTKYKRGVRYVKSKKEEIFLDLLEDHSEIGRFICWAAFTGTIEKLIELAIKHDWYVLRIDSKFMGFSPKGEQVDYVDLLKAMDRGHKNYRELLNRYPKIIAIGHPKAGGNALTLTASPTELYYSNDFDGDARIQSEDRFHRKGMDENRGATIIDLIHLPTDLLILNNLKQKKNLQDITMDNIREYLEEEYGNC